MTETREQSRFLRVLRSPMRALLRGRCDPFDQPNLAVRVWQTPWRDLIRLRLSRRLDWRVVIAGAELPDDVKAMLRKLVGRTRLWKLEKAEVARELVAHFEDALAGGQLPEQTLESFGDYRTVSRLIRRATKRKRSYLWHAWRWSFWSFVALLGCYVLLALYYMTGSPKITKNYVPTLNEQALAVPEGERAWPVMREAMIAMGVEQSGRIAYDAPYADYSVQDLIAWNARPGDARWDEVVAYYAEHAGAMAQLRRAAGMPGLGYVAGYAWDPEDAPLFTPEMTPEQAAVYAEQHAVDAARYRNNQPPLYAVLLPHLGTLRQGSRLLEVEAFVAADQGDAQAAMDALVALIRLGPFAGEQNTLINQLVDVSIRGGALELTSELMARYPDLFSDEQLRDLAHQIAAIRAYSFDISGEKMMMLDTIQHVYTDDGNGKGHLDPQAWRRFTLEMTGANTAFYETRKNTGSEYLIDYAVAPAMIMFTVDRQEMRRMTDYLYGLTAQDMATPPWERPEALVDQAITDLMNQGPLPFSRYGLLTEVMPALGAPRRTAHRYMAMADATLAALALELYRREHGEYPETLDALVPRYLPEVPIDRMNGGPMRYRVGEEGPVLYSVGADRDDDGGHIVYDEIYENKRDPGVMDWTIDEGEAAVDGDWVLWPIHDEREPRGFDAHPPQEGNDESGTLGLGLEKMAIELRQLHTFSELLMVSAGGSDAVSTVNNEMVLAIQTPRYRRLYDEVVRQRDQGQAHLTVGLISASVDQNLDRLDEIRVKVIEQIKTDPSVLESHERYAKEVSEVWFSRQAVIPVDLPDGVLPVTSTGARLSLEINANLLGHTRNEQAMVPLLKIAEYDGTQTARAINALRGKAYSDEAYRGRGNLGRPIINIAVLVDAMDRILMAAEVEGGKASATVRDYRAWRAARDWPEREILTNGFAMMLGGQFEKPRAIEAPLLPARNFEYTNAAGEFVSEPRRGMTEDEIEQIILYAKKFSDDIEGVN